MEKIGEEISNLSAVLEEQLQCESSEMDRDALRQTVTSLNELDVHLELLQHSQIGRLVNQVRKRLQVDERAEDGDLLSTVANLVEKWREIVKSEFRESPQRLKRQRSTNSNGESDLERGASGKRPHKKKRSLTIEDDDAADAQPPLVAPEANDGSSPRSAGSNDDERSGKKTRTSTTGSFDQEDDEGELRSKSVALFVQAMAGEKNTGMETRGDGGFDVLCAKLEEAIYAEYGNANDTHYRRQVRTLLANLKRNTTLRSDFASGKLPPARLAKMTPDQLATVEQRAEREVMEKAIEEHLMPETVPIETGIEKPDDNDQLDLR